VPKHDKEAGGARGMMNILNLNLWKKGGNLWRMKKDELVRETFPYKDRRRSGPLDRMTRLCGQVRLLGVYLKEVFYYIEDGRGG